MLVVAHLDHSVSPGGAELALARVVRTRPGWRPRLFLPRDLRGRAGYLPDSPFERVVYCGPAQPPGATTGGELSTALAAARALGQVAALVRSADLRGVDVVHSNSSRAAVYGAVVARAKGLPLVVHVRDMVSEEALGAAGAHLMRSIVLPSAKAVIANSRASLSSAIPHASGAVAAVAIPSPIGVNRLRVPARLRREISSVGMVARVDRWKGQRLLLEAFARVFRGTGVSLHFIGGTELGGQEYAAELRRRSAELDICSQVRFLGGVEPDRIGSLVDGLDICVQASVRPEPLGQNVLQYLARGRPTLVADVGGPAEWVRDGVNGATFRCGSVDSLAKRLDDLRDLEFRRKVSAAALATIIPSDEEIATRQSEVYEQILRK